MTAATACLNAIGLAFPPHDIHDKFIDFVASSMTDPRERALFLRMVRRSGIVHRRSMLAPAPEAERVDTEDFYRPGAFPSTGARMARFASEAPGLACAAVTDLAGREGGSLAGVTHVVTVTCTGFVAPGLDNEVIARFGLSPSVERTQIGFMGCNAALNALKAARHIVRSEPDARVLVLNLELCTLHFQMPRGVDEALMYLLFGDGASAMLVSAEPCGFSLDAFGQVILPGTPGEITWAIGDSGFNMHLSGDVPRHIGTHLAAHVAELLGSDARRADLWAVHPGGRSVLDAVAGALALPDDSLSVSRAVLADHGNMSSVTVPAILARMLADRPAAGGRRGVALGFGPGLGVESMLFADAA